MSFRIALVSHRFLPNAGGVERHVADLASELARRSHEVAVFAWDNVKSGDGDAPAAPSYDVRRYPTLWPASPGFDRLLVARGLYRDLLRARPDVIHAHSYAFYSFNAAWLASRRLGVPLVVTPHYWPKANEELPWAYRRALGAYDRILGRRIMARDAAAVCAVAPTEARHLVERFGIDRARLHWTPNAVDLESSRGRPGFAREHGIEGDFVLFLGRLSLQKGVHHLVNVAPKIDAPIVIAGPDWGEGARLKALAKSLGVEERVRFVGTLSRGMALSAMSECAVFAMPTHWEAFSITLLEAWANGAAVASSDAGGMADVVEHEANGLVHPVEDEKAFAADVSRLLSDRTLRLRLGEGGREKLRRRFNWKETASRAEAAYGIAPSRETAVAFLRDPRRVPRTA